MADTIRRTCKVCEEDYDGLLIEDNICDSCYEKQGEPRVDHYEETLKNIELNSGLI